MSFFTPRVLIAIGLIVAAAAAALFVLLSKRTPRELRRTSLFVASALMLLGLAVIQLPGAPVGPSDTFGDQGQPFFAKVDPTLCKSMEVIAYDPATASVSQFKVSEDNKGRWTIPSHFDYPADGKDRLKETTAGVIDLTKDTIRSTRIEDHKTFGVLDPLDPKAAGSDGLGKRVTLRDKSGKVLADFIIGKEVLGKPEQRYVRIPDQKRTYGVNVKVDLSTRFSDWIEANLLKLDATKVRRLTFDNHKADPETRTITPGEVLKVEKKDAAGTWSMADLKPDQEVNTDKLDTLTKALSDLKIVGVRPKPAGLTRDLKAKTGEITATRASLLSLSSKGFHMMTNGDLLSNQGDLRVATDEGVVYTLRFGEVTFATGEALSAGSEEKGKQDKGKGKDSSASKSEGGVESRYLLVTAAFDPTLIPDPRAAAPEDPKALPKEVFFDDKAMAEEAKKAKEKAASDLAAYESKVEAGKERTKELTDRFADWYYVVPGDNYRDIVLDRAALTRKKGEKPPTMPGGGFPGMNGMGGGGLPPGLLPGGHP